MQYTDTIKLSFDNNLILGTTPDKISLEMVSNRSKKLDGVIDTGAFGLFDNNSNNLNTFYPDVTADDLIPKDSDFITPTFRALSEVIVHKQWNPVDFSMGETLKKSMALLRGQTVNVDHETAIANALGAVMEVSWEESYKAAGGIIIPAGINSKLKIDGKSNPRIARGITMDPPSIHSTSVTVNFMWAKSHANLTQDEFFDKIGTELDGSLVRRIATSINRYNEISLVPHGADPFAQLIKDGTIANPKYAKASYSSLSEVPGELKSHAKHYYFDFKSDLISNNEITSIPKHSNNIKLSSMRKEMLIMLSAMLGITIANTDAPTTVELEALETGLTANIANQAIATSNTALAATALTTANTEVARLKLLETELIELKETSKNVVSLQAFQTTELGKARTETVANYNKLAGATPDQAVLTMLSTADHPTLQLMNKQYQTQLEEKYPLSCKACKSTDISRATAEAGNTSSKDEPTGLEKFLATKRGMGAGIATLHGEVPTV
jgi:hypothetical protein